MPVCSDAYLRIPRCLRHTAQAWFGGQVVKTLLGSLAPSIYREQLCDALMFTDVQECTMSSQKIVTSPLSTSSASASSSSSPCLCSTFRLSISASRFCSPRQVPPFVASVSSSGPSLEPKARAHWSRVETTLRSSVYNLSAGARWSGASFMRYPVRWVVYVPV